MRFSRPLQPSNVVVETINIEKLTNRASTAAALKHCATSTYLSRQQYYYRPNARHRASSLFVAQSNYLFISLPVGIRALVDASEQASDRAKLASRLPVAL